MMISALWTKYSAAVCCVLVVSLIAMLAICAGVRKSLVLEKERHKQTQSANITMQMEKNITAVAMRALEMRITECEALGATAITRAEERAAINAEAKNSTVPQAVKGVVNDEVRKRAANHINNASW